MYTHVSATDDCPYRSSQIDRIGLDALLIRGKQSGFSMATRYHYTDATVRLRSP